MWLGVVFWGDWETACIKKRLTIMTLYNMKRIGENSSYTDIQNRRVAMEKEKNCEGIILKEELHLKWRDLHKIRQSLSSNLQQCNFTRQQTDPIIIIISELLENAFKYIDKKFITVIIKYTSEKKDHLMIKIHHPISTFQSHNLRILLSTISKVNQCEDVEKLFLDSLREATLLNSRANKFRFSLIRKTAQGAHINIKKSLIYNPGIIIGIPYNL